MKNHTCCDGECNHDDCCGKVPENCPDSKNIIQLISRQEVFDLIDDDLKIVNQFTGEGIVTQDMKNAMLIALKDIKIAIACLDIKN